MAEFLLALLIFGTVIFRGLAKDNIKSSHPRNKFTDPLPNQKNIKNSGQFLSLKQINKQRQ